MIVKDINKPEIDEVSGGKGPSSSTPLKHVEVIGIREAFGACSCRDLGVSYNWWAESNPPWRSGWKVSL
jgi:hypothetical protein